MAKILVVLIFIVMGTTSVFSVSYDRNPHDKEWTCNKCHGINSKYGQPETGKHNDHLNEVNTSRFSFDPCDECHNIEDHMNGTIQVTLSGFDPVSRNCSSMRCHSTDTEKSNPKWGASSGSYSTNSFVKEYVRKNCVQCHSSAVDMDGDTRETVILNKSIQRLCMDDCHKRGADNEVKVNHPVNIKPSPILFEAMENQSEFEKFPLDEWDSITCNTCHDPHGESCQSCHFDFENEKVYPDGLVIKKSTVFLRSSDGKLDEYDYEKHTYGDNPLYFDRVADNLCKVCHEIKSSNRVRIENPHWERQCMSCHKEFPYNINEVCVSWRVNNFNRVELRESVDVDTKYEIKIVCRECHNKSDHLHPIDVEPKGNVPSDIPLDRWKSITCYTCHDPHLPYGETAMALNLPAYRRKNIENDLCQACHSSDQKFTNKNPHTDNKCKFCHVVIPELTEPDFISSKSDIVNRCNTCHKEDKNTHPINIVPKMELSGFPLAVGNKINCATCHPHHEPAKLLFVDKLKKGEKSSCFNCHE